MTLTPNFLPVGSIVEYDYKNELGKMPVVVYGIHPPTPQKEPRLDGKWLVDIWVDGTTYTTTPIDDISPIPLTPEILTEWCGFEKESDMSEKDATWTIKYVGFTCVHDERDEIGIFANGGNSFTVLFNEQTLTVITHLHQLQHLYSALTQTVLPITIK